MAVERVVGAVLGAGAVRALEQAGHAERTARVLILLPLPGMLHGLR